MGDRELYSQDAGLKYFKNYGADAHGLQPQNWSITQDLRGVIYVANHGGVLEYDGVSWNAVRIPNLEVRSLAADDSGTIYVGGLNELGYLTHDADGLLKYQSLLSHLDEDKRDCNEVWRTHAVGGDIFFRTSYYIFRWAPRTKTMTVLAEADKEIDDKFNGSFTGAGEYFINQRSIGLSQFKNGSFQPVPGGDRFTSRKFVYMVTPYDDAGEKWLIGCQSEGMFLYDGRSMIPFVTEVDDYLKEKKAYYGVALSRSPGHIAIATLRGGLVVIDQRGKLKYRFTKTNGQPVNSVKWVFEDARGNLWTALENGISKIEYLSPLSFYSDAAGLTGMVLAVTRYAGKLYVGASQGLFRRVETGGAFKPVRGVADQCWWLLSIGDTLLAATSDGVYQVRNDAARLIAGEASYFLSRSRRDPNRVWAGVGDSLFSLYRRTGEGNSDWRVERKFEKVDLKITTIAEERNGDLWLGVRPDGVIHLRFTGKDARGDYDVTPYGASHRLPEKEIQVFHAAGHTMFGTKKGLFRFDEEKKIFIPDTTLGEVFSAGLKDVFRVVEDGDNAIWLHGKGRNYRAVPRPDGTYDVMKKPLARIPLNAQVNCIYPDASAGVTWFATHKGLIRFEPGVKKDYDCKYLTLIRKVFINGTPQFFNPAFCRERSPDIATPSFIYNDRNLRFEFVAPFFEDENRTSYRVMLEGDLNEWSNWTTEARKDYTNLDPGVYNFRVQAQNIYGIISREAAFGFEILPPWYRTWWAYGIYVLLLISSVYLIIKWRSMKLELEKQKLERMVKERAEEIQLKNRQLEKQAARLQELDHAKSRFFADVSHQFRTPLTLIIGPLERMLSAGLPDPMKDNLGLMHRHSQRLLTLINQLLKLSRLDDGKLKLQTAVLDIIPFLKGRLASFEHEARDRNLDIVFRTEADSVPLYGDVERMEDVFGNLFSNAVKFTPDGGTVTASLKPHEEPTDEFPSGYLEISVHNTGGGIPKDQLEYIFDRFYQVDSNTQKHKGSGIGLALAKELIRLHHGRIDAHSREGDDGWTEFIIHWPLGKDHLTPDELAGPEAKKSPPRPADEKDGTDKTGCTGSQPVESDTLTPETETGGEAEGDYTILVVEDNPDMRHFIRETLEPHYTVVEAVDGREGIQKATESSPDLVISDIMMPEMDGYHLCEQLKTSIETSHIPVILLTAKASDDSRVKGLGTGADDYLTKPFGRKVLLSRIENLIDLRRQLRKKYQEQLLLMPSEITVSTMDQEFLEKLHGILDKELSDPDLNVEALSEKMAVSRVTLNKKVYALTGEHPTDIICSYRLERAVQLLKESFGSITDVALEVGFSSSAYFTKCFKKKFKQTPTAYLRKKLKKKKPESQS